MSDTFQHPVERLGFWSQQSPEQVYLRQPKGNQWQEKTYRDVQDQVARLANALSSLPPRSHIAIYSLNCADWFIADLAILMAGHISVPIYPTAGPDTIRYILKHSQIELAFVGKLFDWDNKKECFFDIPCVAIFNKKSSMPFIDDVVNEQEPISRVYEPTEQDIATLIYTSGTTGDPKGVMISYGAINNAMQSVAKIFSIKPTDQFFSYLPLAHVAERMVVEMASVTFGACVSFVESLDTFANNLRSVQPTIFFAVPRIWMKMKSGVEKKLGGSWFSGVLFRTPGIGSWLRKKLKKALGLDHVRLSLSGAASLPKSILDWFESLDIIICEAYGLSETCALSHINLPDKRKAGSVGQLYPGAECMIADNGEVLLRNASMMMGYYNEPELTAAVIQDGWFRTGDLGEVDDNGFLTITGRVKELFKTSKGKYISPVPIENKLEPLLGAEHLCISGANLPQPIAIIALLGDITPAIKKQFEKRCNDVIAQVNQQLEKHERIRQVLVVNEEWTTDNGLMTPTLKLRRQPIEKRYEKEIETFREGKAPKKSELMFQWRIDR